MICIQVYTQELLLKIKNHRNSMTLDQWLSVINIVVSVAVAFIVFCISKRLSVKDKYEHEMNITQKLKEIPAHSSIILANVLKYNPTRTDKYNNTYYKQGAEIYTIIPEFGLQVILNPKTKEEIPVGVIPFEWIEYIRDHDSEDNKYIVVCKFKGVKYFEDFKSPFKEINTIYENKDYKDFEPKFLKYTTVKANNL